MDDRVGDSTLSTFTASDGDNLAVQDWPLAQGIPARGVVLLVHGLGEHAGRYDRLARCLNGWGFAVRGYDQCGHGESSGARGVLPTDTRLIDDLADVVDSLRSRMDERMPLVLLGHSMGGLVVSCFVALRRRPVEAVVLSSPALDPGLGPLQKLLLAVLPRVAPNLTVPNGLKPALLSRDPEVVRAYVSDPRVHDRVSPRLGRFIADGARLVRARAHQWKVPTLLMYAGSDGMVNAQGSREFAAATPPGVVTERCFEDFYHEIFNEPDAQAAFDCLRDWLDARFQQA